MRGQLTDEQKRYLKNQAFDLFRENLQVTLSDDGHALASGVSPAKQLTMLTTWLEKTVKTMDEPMPVRESSAYFFSPGKECKCAILDLCRTAKASMDICVFTISDNDIRDHILAAHRRGVQVRVISDNDKADDRGADTYALLDAGVPVRFDRSEAHMHHKFALFDKTSLLNGSFNWTRSASEYNHENITVVTDVLLRDKFQREFDRLWQVLER